VSSATLPFAWVDSNPVEPTVNFSQARIAFRQLETWCTSAEANDASEAEVEEQMSPSAMLDVGIGGFRFSVGFHCGFGLRTPKPRVEAALLFSAGWWLILTTQYPSSGSNTSRQVFGD